VPDANPPVETVIEVDTRSPGTAISPDLFGAFFEDLNYAADGGLYAELVQNRSFEYSPADRPEWHSLTAWDLLERDGAAGWLTVSTDDPLHPVNPHYAVLHTAATGTAGLGAGLRNEGFDGIPVRAGETYDVSAFARLAHGTAVRLVAQIESRDGSRVHGRVELGPVDGAWQRHVAVIICGVTDPDARFTLTATGTGTVHLDMVSLFPQATFLNRPGGLRADLAQAIADLKPKFLRFPGGCLAHGQGLANMYRWSETVGPLHERRQQFNIWHYHQSMGLGYYEYFQFCEDIGAKPVPVVPAGVCCQNSDVTGQVGIPDEEMDAYIAEVLALVEWANGPADSPWGALRAAAGHPEPFGVEYLGVGNEDTITDTFRDRFFRIHDALREHHPEITVIGTLGPATFGEDWEKGWAFARERDVPVVDEHAYKSPRWLLENSRRFDRLDREGPHLYIGEYGSWCNDGRGALAEALYMITMERNGDVVRMASYAPLLAKRDHTQWLPDLIYFDNTNVWTTLNYHVQHMHSLNPGDIALPVTVTGAPEAPGRPGERPARHPHRHRVRHPRRVHRRPLRPPRRRARADPRLPQLGHTGRDLGAQRRGRGRIGFRPAAHGRGARNVVRLLGAGEEDGRCRGVRPALHRDDVRAPLPVAARRLGRPGDLAPARGRRRAGRPRRARARRRGERSLVRPAGGGGRRARPLLPRRRAAPRRRGRPAGPGGLRGLGRPRQHLRPRDPEDREHHTRPGHGPPSPDRRAGRHRLRAHHPHRLSGRRQPVRSSPGRPRARPADRPGLRGAGALLHRPAHAGAA
jgi:alpha-L-arabinofuranosidase